MRCLCVSCIAFVTVQSWQRGTAEEKAANDRHPLRGPQQEIRGWKPGHGIAGGQASMKGPLLDLAMKKKTLLQRGDLG
ncbi:hypothetical protein J3F84DRAFT_375746 [Trichoderma pleuroticola]